MKMFVFIFLAFLSQNVLASDIQCVTRDSVALCVDENCQAIATYSSENAPYGWRITFVDRVNIGLHFESEDINWDALNWIEINWDGGEKKLSMIDITDYVDFCNQVVENNVYSFELIKLLYR